MLGAVSFIMFVGPNNKGLLYINIMLLFFFPLTGIRLFSCSYHYFFIQVWAATESGNLEVTYTHKEEHVGYAVPVIHFFTEFQSMDINGTLIK
jgi:hypothetical protein